MVFWQSPRTRKQARPDVRVPTARAAGIDELEMLVDAHERYPYRFATRVADGLAELQVRWPTIPIVFCENRKLAEEWTYRYLAAAQAWAVSERAVLDRIGTGEDGTERGLAQPPPSTAEVRAWARAAGMPVSDRGRLRPEIHRAWREAHQR